VRKTSLIVTLGMGLSVILALLFVWGDPSSPALAAPRAEEIEAPGASIAAPVHQPLTGFGVTGTSQDVRMGVFYGYDETAGMYEVGHTFWITVTDAGGAPKAHATATTTTEGTAPYFAYSDGFCVEKEDWSDPSLDIQPGDRVHFLADDGYTNSVLVGTITARLNATANTVAGTITAPEFVEPLNCGAGWWGSFWETFTVDPNGGSYLVDFSPFDLLPGMEVTVHYEEPDKDAVGNVFWVPRGQVFLPLVLRNW
jgi:hypothetical protein